MNHYSLNDWKYYTKDLLDEDKRGEMEEHLFSCDHCLQIYLKVVDEVNSDKEVLNEEFTEKIIKSIVQDKELNKSRRRTKYPANIFLYYTAAASITLLLISQGFFTSMTKAIPRSAVQIMDTSKYFEKVSQSPWTNNLLQKTINIFENGIK